MHLMDPHAVQGGPGLVQDLDERGRLTVGQRNDELGAGADVIEERLGLDGLG
jgi:hypothetical protein